MLFDDDEGPSVWGQISVRGKKARQGSDASEPHL